MQQALAGKACMLKFPAARRRRERPAPPAAGAHRPLGIDGWRLAFLAVAAVSALAGLLNALFTQDPRRGSAEQQDHDHHGWGPPEKPSLRKLGREVLSVIRIPTFIIIVAQASGHGA